MLGIGDPSGCRPVTSADRHTGVSDGKVEQQRWCAGPQRPASRSWAPTRRRSSGRAGLGPSPSITASISFLGSVGRAAHPQRRTRRPSYLRSSRRRTRAKKAAGRRPRIADERDQGERDAPRPAPSSIRAVPRTSPPALTAPDRTRRIARADGRRHSRADGQARLGHRAAGGQLERDPPATTRRASRPPAWAPGHTASTASSTITTAHTGRPPLRGAGSSAGLPTGPGWRRWRRRPPGRSPEARRPPPRPALTDGDDGFHNRGMILRRRRPTDGLAPSLRGSADAPRGRRPGSRPPPAAVARRTPRRSGPRSEGRTPPRWCGHRGGSPPGRPRERAGARPGRSRRSAAERAFSQRALPPRRAPSRSRRGARPYRQAAEVGVGMLIGDRQVGGSGRRPAGSGDRHPLRSA